MRKPFILSAAAIIAAAFLSCSKDDETTTKPSLSGITITSVSPYLAVGESVTFTINASKVVNSSDDEDFEPGNIGVWWQVNSATRDTITLDISSLAKFTKTYRPDTLGNYTITCGAFTVEETCYSTSATTTFQAIDPENAIEGLAGTRVPGEKYLTVTAGGLTWMAENLYETASGISYNGCEVMNAVFGRYYSQEEALTACPDGWRLPTAAEWDALGQDAGALMANASFLGTYFWTYTKDVPITNATGFNAIAVGYVDKTGIETYVNGEKEYAAFWTSDTNGDLGMLRYIYGSNPLVQSGEASKTSLALSVRCVK